MVNKGLKNQALFLVFEFTIFRSPRRIEGYADKNKYDKK